MKKYGYQITVFFMLLVAVFLVNEYRKGTSLSRRDIAFAVENTDQIDGVIITGSETRVELIRDNGQWLLGSGYEARPRAVDLLFQTLRRLRVNSPVPESDLEFVMEKLALEAGQIDVISGRRTRTYIYWSDGNVGPTYMMRKGGRQPYIVEVLGFDGNVASLFVDEEGFWRTNILFAYIPGDISDVTVSHAGDAGGSFTLSRNEENGFSLYSIPDGEDIGAVNDSLAIRYLANFIYVPFERMAGPQETELFDSLYASVPDYRVSVTLHDGTSNEVLFHRIRKDGDGSDDNGFDLFRLHAIIGSGPEMVVVPYHSVDLLLRRYTYFTGGSVQKGGD